MTTGIQLVRVAVHNDDFSKLQDLIIDMMFTDTTKDLKKFREKHGKLRWTTGRSLVNDNWIEIFIGDDDFVKISRYGDHTDKIWDK